MYFSLLADILLAMLAVFGFYAIIRLFVTSCLSPVTVAVTLEVGAGVEAEDLPMLLERASERLWLCGTDRLLVLLDPALAEKTGILAALQAMEIPYCFGKLTSEGKGG